MEPHQISDEPANISLQPQVADFYWNDLHTEALRFGRSHTHTRSDPYAEVGPEPEMGDQLTAPFMSRRLPGTRTSPTAISAHPDTMAALTSMNGQLSQKPVTWDINFLGGPHVEREISAPHHPELRREVPEDPRSWISGNNTTSNRKTTLTTEFFVQEDEYPHNQYDKHVHGTSTRSEKILFMSISLAALLILPLLKF